ncbi:hypothetical protein QAD02_011296 [Eretmocerus hayati]|uniref:Uncharacterized protein n=1 Tax=Eretmocerus hayati TaxID=131215 RepID=A0ACC2P135_9HYME|nr:hypothetical protein QAD02_011296 [Eretmocerus hayati]
MERNSAGYSDDSSRELVDKGNEFLMQQNNSEAIKKYDQAIEKSPYYAVPHYNKRIALSMQNGSPSESTEDQGNDIDINLLRHAIEHLDLTNQNKPYFVTSVIAAVQELPFSDDSSGEDSDEEFNELYDESVKNNFFPFTTRKKTAKKSGRKTAQLKSEMKPIEPELLSAFQDTAVSKVVDPLLSKILKNGFEKHEQDKLPTIAVSVGLNRMYSLSTRRNNSLVLELESKVNTTGIKCEKFGYYWPCPWYYNTKDMTNTRHPWYTKNGEEANIEDVRKFYHQLKRKNPDLAKKFIAQEEDERSGRDIPYQDIREYAKNHDKTTELIKNFRDSDSNALIYLHLLDADVYDCNKVYSAYLRILRSCYKPPTVMSTGYKFPKDKENLAHHLLSDMERMHRVITIFYIPLGTYYPEPNMCILVPRKCKTVDESFIDGKRNQRGTLESPILLTDIQNKRDNVDAIFSDDNPIITEIPLRAKNNRTTGTPIKFSGAFMKGLVGPDDEDFKKYAQVSQSHTHNLTWAKHLFINKSIKYEGDWKTKGAYILGKKGNPLIGVDKQCNKLIKNIRNNSDVKKSRDELAHRIGKDNVDKIVNADEHIKKFDVDFNKDHARTPEERELIDIINKCDISYSNLSRKLILMMVEHNVADFIKSTEDEKEAYHVFENIVKLFSEYEGEYNNLSEQHGMVLNEIISWDFEKIEFLGSDDIIKIIDKFHDQDIFHHIQNLYDEDKEIACNFVKGILHSEKDLTDIDFENLEDKYVEIARNIMKRPDHEYYEIDMSGGNIIDLIVRDMDDDSEYGLIDSGCSTPRASYSDEVRMWLYPDISNVTSDDDSSFGSDEDGSNVGS